MTTPISDRESHIAELLTGLEVDAEAVAEGLGPGDVDALAPLAAGDDSILARRATVAAGALAGKLAERHAEALNRAVDIVMRAADDKRYRVRLAAAAASDTLPRPQRDEVRLALLARPDAHDDAVDPERGNYIVQVAVLKSLDFGSPGADANGKLREIVEKLAQSSPEESVKNHANEALKPKKPQK